MRIVRRQRFESIVDRAPLCALRYEPADEYPLCSKERRRFTCQSLGTTGQWLRGLLIYSMESRVGPEAFFLHVRRTHLELDRHLMMLAIEKACGWGEGHAKPIPRIESLLNVESLADTPWRVRIRRRGASQFSLTLLKHEKSLGQNYCDGPSLTGNVHLHWTHAGKRRSYSAASLEVRRGRGTTYSILC